MKTLALKTLLFCALLLAGQAVISLDWELVRSLDTGRIRGVRVGRPMPYEASHEILAIQQYQQTHPALGFLWKSNIDTADQVVVAWGDIPAGAITTDEFGFAASPSAIEMRRDGVPVDIIGLGASYIGGAQGVFHDYFALNGYFYYNLAHGRFTLPQYNLALKDPGLSMKPKWAVYGINEVSFALIPDFEGWRNSGLDWFEYHSGTWCGPAVKTGFPHDYLKRWPRVYDMYRVVLKSLFREGLPGSVPSRANLMEKTLRYTAEAYRTARDNGINFVVLLIPCKNRMAHGPSPALYMFEELVPRLREAAIPFIDLRDSYREAEDPSQLYFQFDAHWNNIGIYRAAREVLAHIEKHSGLAGGSE